MQTRTFVDLIKYWKEINGYDNTKCIQIFPSYSKWIYEGLLPKRDSTIDLICDKTGFKKEEIIEAINESNNKAIFIQQGKEQVRKFNLKYNKDVIEKINEKPATPSDTNNEIVEYSDFDEVLKDYIRYNEEKEALMQEFITIKDKLEKIKIKNRRYKRTSQEVRLIWRIYEVS